MMRIVSLRPLLRMLLGLAAIMFLMAHPQPALAGSSSPVGVTYQAQVQNIGWQNWVSDGALAGTVGQSLRMETIRIKGTNLPAGAHIKYQAHVQNIGWQNWVTDGAMAGTVGQSLRVEALRIVLEGAPGYSIQYQTQVQNVGWQNWVADGALAGTTGKSLRVESIRIKIVKVDTSGSGTVVPGQTTGLSATSPASNQANLTWNLQSGATSYNIYRAASAAGPFIKVGTATSNSYTDSGLSASTAYSYEVSAVNSAGEGALSASVTVTTAAVPTGSFGVAYQAQVQNIGWQNTVTDGAIAGTIGQSLRLEALKINLVNPPQGAQIKYQAQVQNIGWQPWVSNGAMAGTVGQSLRVESIRIVLENAPGYSVEYQAQVQNIGWQNWVSDGQIAGTVGQSLRMEALRIRIVKAAPKTVAAWLPNWDQTRGLTELQNNPTTFNEISPFWYDLGTNGNLVPLTNSESSTVIQFAKDHGTKIYPLISNEFKGDLVSTLINNSTLMQTNINNIVSKVNSMGYDGIQLDYENIQATDKAAYTRYVQALANALHNNGKQLIIVVQAKTTDNATWAGPGGLDYQALGQAADQIWDMAYDYSWSGSAPGPIAPVSWVKQVAAYATANIPANKVVLGLPTYGYDWIGSSGQGINYDQAIARAAQYGATIKEDPLNGPSFSYTDGNKVQHQVWFEDANSLASLVDVANADNLAGVALWKLAGQDQNNFAVLRSKFPN